MDAEQRLFLFHAFAGFDSNAVDNSIAWRFELVLHFHGFENKQHLSFFDFLPFGNRDSHDQPGHGRFEMILTRFFHTRACCNTQTFFALILDRDGVKTSAQKHLPVIIAALHLALM